MIARVERWLDGLSISARIAIWLQLTTIEAIAQTLAGALLLAC
jgi:hypothetical protein